MIPRRTKRQIHSQLRQRTSRRRKATLIRTNLKLDTSSLELLLYYVFPTFNTVFGWPVRLTGKLRRVVNQFDDFSSPSIVLAARGGHGDRIIFDDFREAYYWLRQNTHENAKVMSWWDYGYIVVFCLQHNFDYYRYQLSAMANRTVIVDNNTWNNTHISRVGQAMASSEEHAYEIMKELDVDYVLVIFGGLTGKHVKRECRNWWLKATRLTTSINSSGWFALEAQHQKAHTYTSMTITQRTGSSA